MAGVVVSIEIDLKSEGREEILQSLNPRFFEIVGSSNPRVVTGCSILLYFTNKMLDFGLDESSAEEMKARVLKHMIETVLPILLEPDPSDPKSQENPKSQDIRKQESNIFNHFATVLLQSCEDLDTDEFNQFIRILPKRKGQKRPA